MLAEKLQSLSEQCSFFANLRAEMEGEEQARQEYLHNYISTLSEVKEIELLRNVNTSFKFNGAFWVQDSVRCEVVFFQKQRRLWKLKMQA